MTTVEPSLDRRQGADEHWVVASAKGTARCSLWWRNVPWHPGQTLGLIGHYEADSDAAAVTLLDHACTVLQQHGCTLAVGPMDGSTWRRYRLITERGDQPPFFLEPDHPPSLPAHFVSAGFAPLATYTSALTEDLTTDDARVERAAERLRRQDFTIRSLREGAFNGELRTLYRLSLRAFAGNFLYTPIAEDEFLLQYRAMRQQVQAELVLIAEHSGEPAGFLFAVPDLLQRQRGQAVDTVVFKTLAVDPRWQGRGLGSVLLREAYRAAARLGFRRGIHAMMPEGNESTRISARQAQVFRRYALFARSVAV